MPTIIAPFVPTVPTLAVSGVQGAAAGNMDAAHLSDFSALVLHESSTVIAATGDNDLGFSLTGQNFTYTGGALTGGLGQHLTLHDVANGVTVLQIDIALPNADVSSFELWLASDQTATAFATFLGGGDRLGGSTFADLIRAYGGDDVLYGSGGDDTLYGGTGNDVIYAARPPAFAGYAPAGTTWIRGEEGDDYILGGQGFDNVNGNQGADTIDGGQGGGDWLLGGQGSDMIFAHTGANIINGNLGDDSIVGGDGYDSLRGGQGADIIWAGSGGDWITGDRGDDTLMAGRGSDTFYVIPNSGADQVQDFDTAHDHVQLAADVAWQASQVGADTVLDFGQGNTMTLVGVQLSALPSGWITTA